MLMFLAIAKTPKMRLKGYVFEGCGYGRFNVLLLRDTSDGQTWRKQLAKAKKRRDGTCLPSSCLIQIDCCIIFVGHNTCFQCQRPRKDTYIICGVKAVGIQICFRSSHICNPLFSSNSSAFVKSPLQRRRSVFP